MPLTLAMEVDAHGDAPRRNDFYHSPPDPDMVTSRHPGSYRTVRRRRERFAHWRT